MSINTHMGRQAVVHPHNRILRTQKSTVCFHQSFKINVCTPQASETPVVFNGGISHTQKTHKTLQIQNYFQILYYIKKAVGEND